MHIEAESRILYISITALILLIYGALQGGILNMLLCEGTLDKECNLRAAQTFPEAQPRTP